MSRSAFADRVGARVDLLPEQRRGRVGVQPVQVLVGDSEHAAGADCRVVDRPDGATVAQGLGVLGVDQVDQESHDVAGGVELTGTVIGRLGEPVDEVLEQVAHVGVRHRVGRQVDLVEVAGDLCEPVALVESADDVLEAERLEHVQVRGETADVVDEVLAQVVRVLQRLLQRVGAGGPERQSGTVLGASGDLEMRAPLLLAGILGDDRGHCLTVRLHHALQATQHREGQDDGAVLGLGVRTAQSVGNTPHETRQNGHGY